MIWASAGMILSVVVTMLLMFHSTRAQLESNDEVEKIIWDVLTVFFLFLTLALSLTVGIFIFVNEVFS